MANEKPRRLTKKSDRKMARFTRDFQWEFMERAAKHDPLWFCVWNKRGLPVAPDEMRCCLMSGMDVLSWTDAHKDWFEIGEWSEERYAPPVRLTESQSWVGKWVVRTSLKSRITLQHKYYSSEGRPNAKHN